MKIKNKKNNNNNNNNANNNFYGTKPNKHMIRIKPS